MNDRYGRDGAGVMRACNERGVSFTYASEWPAELFEKGRAGTAEANLRTWSKGSARGAGPQKQQARVRRTGGAADAVAMCKHGLRAIWCASCQRWYCACPGSPKHACPERP